MKKRSAKPVLIAAGVVVLAGIVLYVGGFFSGGKIEPGRSEPGPAKSEPPARQALAKRVLRTETYVAVGTIRPRTETKIEAQISGRVLKVNVRPGDTVGAGQVLVLLSDQGPRARLEQARQDLRAAQAANQLAEAEFGRIQRLHQQKAAPARDLDRAREAAERSRALLRRAQERVQEAKVAEGYTRVTAPEAGKINKRLIEPGDLAQPGRPLLIMQTGGGLRLEALVREGLINKVRLGQNLKVMVPALQRSLTGSVEEIVPSADPATRSFLVKVLLTKTDDLYPGMFGRLVIPIGQRQAIMIPKGAVRRVGQLEMVLVKEKKGWVLIYITTGGGTGDTVEVLSGLEGGETVGITERAHGR